LKHFATSEYWDSFDKLPKSIQRAARKNYDLFIINLCQADKGVGVSIQSITEFRSDARLVEYLHAKLSGGHAQDVDFGINNGDYPELSACFGYLSID
jgi:hypothetical protein